MKKHLLTDQSNNDLIEEAPNGPLVSIVVATYNHAEYLQETLGSILNQTYKKLEIIIIDDGSTDNTREVVAAFPVIYHYQENCGSSNAFNFGVRMSHGEFYITPGADDCIDPCFVEKCLEKMMTDIKVGFVWTGAQEFGESNKIKTPKPLLNRLSIYRGTGGQLGAALFRRKAFDDVGGYDETLPVYEDWDFAIRLVKCGWKGLPVMEPIYFWRRHKVSRNTKSNPEVSRRFLEKKHPNMRLYASIARGIDILNLIAKNPKAFSSRLFKKVS